MSEDSPPDEWDLALRCFLRYSVKYAESLKEDLEQHSRETAEAAPNIDPEVLKVFGAAISFGAYLDAKGYTLIPPPEMLKEKA